MLFNKKFVLIVLMVVMVFVGTTACGHQPEGKYQPNNESYKVIESKYVDWTIPSKCMEFLKYENEVNNTVVSDMFYMLLDGQEVPVFRFDFGDKNLGDWLGQLTVGEEKIAVVYTVFMVSDEELAGTEGAHEIYYMIMDVFTNMMNDIEENVNFSTEHPLAVGDDTNMAMTYWTVVLPDTMRVSETTENGNYEAMFAAEVAGERVQLYRVCVGKKQAESFLGYFEIDGVKQPVSVEAFELAERANWSEDDYAAAYRMMDTINNVIEVIMSSKQFSAEAE